MMALHDDNQIYTTCQPGGWFTLPNGDKASPAKPGWQGAGGLRLSEINDADAVPDGKQSTGRSVQLIDGAPKWVHDLVDLPPAPPRSIHPAWLRLALIEIDKMDAVNAAVASQGPAKVALWEYATGISEADPDVNAVADALGIDLSAAFDRAEAIRNQRQG